MHRHTGHCSANIQQHHSIGDEFSWAKQCMEDLHENRIQVKHVTTDCDSRAAQSAQYMYEGKFIQNPVHMKDTRHLGGAQASPHKKHKIQQGHVSGKESSYKK